MSAVRGILDRYIREVSGEERVVVNSSGSIKTVALREVYDYEEQLVNEFIEPRTDLSITGGAVPIKGRWIEGWLTVQGDDFINNIHKNYQFFLTYLKARTIKIENSATYDRTAGDYDSTYRYLLLLEDLGLVERYKREEVPQSEYDIPVPSEFRTRTFIRKEKDYSSAKDAWNNPDVYDGESTQDIDDLDIDPGDTGEPSPDEQGVGEEDDSQDEDGGVDVDELLENEDLDDEQEETSIDIEPTGADTFIDDDVSPDDSTESEPEPDSIQEPDVSGSGASIDDFQSKDFLVQVISDNMTQALSEAFEDPPVPSDLDESDISVGRIAVFGPWAEGEATVQDTPLSMLISIKSSGTNLGFVPSATQRRLKEIMDKTNLFDSSFPSYEIVVVYNNAYKKRLSDLVMKTQSEDVYYSLTDKEFKEL
jgi:hypothetical protein